MRRSYLQNSCNQQSIDNAQEARNYADRFHCQHIAVEAIGNVFLKQKLLVAAGEFAESFGCTNVDVVCLVVIC